MFDAHILSMLNFSRKEVADIDEEFNLYGKKFDISNLGSLKNLFYINDWNCEYDDEVDGIVCEVLTTLELPIIPFMSVILVCRFNYQNDPNYYTYTIHFYVNKELFNYHVVLSKEQMKELEEISGYDFLWYDWFFTHKITHKIITYKSY